MRSLVAAASLATLLVLPAIASAQPASMVEVAPIGCWWQSSAGAITIGLAFDVTLTCAVLETESAQVVPDEARLNVASVQLSPFEILGGDHPPDSRSGSRRFLQYRYTLRTLDRDLIGHDVKIPALPISYRVHSRVGADAALEGRDLTYILPAIPVRVLSIVPAEASDIRDAGDASLGAVDAFRFRSSLFTVLAVTLAVFAAILVVWGIMPLVTPAVRQVAEDHSRLPDRLVIHRVVAELLEVQRLSHAGWTDALVMRALSALRLAAALAIGKPIGQRILATGGAVPEGRLLVQRGWPRPLQVTVSSPATADDVERAIAALPDSASVTKRQQLAGLRDGLQVFTAAVYPHTPVRYSTSLDEAIRHALSVATGHR